MFSIILTIFIFLVTFFVQLIVVRIFRRFRIHTFASFGIYSVGLLLIALYVMPYKELPYTSILVYILLTLLLITFSFVPLLGQRSPSSIIMSMLREKRQTASELESAFDEKYMIHGRLADLVKTGLLYKNGDIYIISPFGSYAARIISTTCTLMGLSPRG